jgi:hypothetical protein
MNWRLIIILLLCVVFWVLVVTAIADPNILSRQFWGTTDPNYPFIVIEELSPRKYRYVSVEPNLLPSWEFTVDKARTYRLNSISALHYIAVNCPKLIYVNTLSRYWIPIPVQINPSGYFLCFSDGKSKVYHDPNCPYTKLRKIESIPDFKLKEYNPCPVCRPDIKIMIKDLTDPNLIKAITEIMSR